MSLTALQRSNRGKCAHLLRDLDATVDLPLTARLSHSRCWTSPTGVGSEGPGIEAEDVFTLAAAAYIGIKLDSARYPDRAPFLRPDPQQPRHPVGSLTDLLTALATPGRRQPHNLPPLHTAEAVHEVVSEEYRILNTLNFEVGVSLRDPLLPEC